MNLPVPLLQFQKKGCWGLCELWGTKRWSELHGIHRVASAYPLRSPRSKCLDLSATFKRLPGITQKYANDRREVALVAKVSRSVATVFPTGYD